MTDQSHIIADIALILFMGFTFAALLITNYRKEVKKMSALDLYARSAIRANILAKEGRHEEAKSESEKASFYARQVKRNL